jgi:hypothetical protein
VPGRALGKEGIAVTVNARPVGRITKGGRQECVFEVPADVVGTQTMARLEWTATTWKPSEVNPGSGDDRALGVSVRQVEVFRVGAEQVPAQSVTLRFEPDREALSPLQRKIGRGMTTMLPGLADDERLIAALLPGTMDGRFDRRYATQTDSGVIWYDANEARIWRTDE